MVASRGALHKLFPTVSPSVHPVVASISLPTNGAFPKLFPTVSPPSTLSSLPSRSFSTQLSPEAISHGFPSVHPVVASISLLPLSSLSSPSFPRSLSPMLFPTVSSPSTQSSLPSVPSPTDLSPIYFPPSRHFHLAANAARRERKHRRCFWEKENVIKAPFLK